MNKHDPIIKYPLFFALSATKPKGTTITELTT